MPFFQSGSVFFASWAWVVKGAVKRMTKQEIERRDGSLFFIFLGRDQKGNAQDLQDEEVCVI